MQPFQGVKRERCTAIGHEAQRLRLFGADHLAQGGFGLRKNRFGLAKGRQQAPGAFGADAGREHQPQPSAQFLGGVDHVVSLCGLNGRRMHVVLRIVVQSLARAKSIKSPHAPTLPTA